VGAAAAMISPTPVPPKKLFQSPPVSLLLTLLVLTTAFTQLIEVLLNQPIAYWLSSQAATPEVPLKLPFQGGPWLYLALVLLYLIVLAILLRKLNASAGLALACGAFCFHLIILYWGSQPSFYPLFELYSGDIRTCIYFSTFAVFIAAFVSILVLRPSQKIVRWLKPVGCAFMLGWVVLLSMAVVKMAFPPPSVWSRVISVHSPGLRTSAALAYDTQRHRAVLFGGTSSRNASINIFETNTWEWDGQDWYEFRTEIAPSGRSNHAMAFDSDKGKVYLYGGTDRNGKPLSDLWEWDGAAWHRLCPVCNPAGRSQHAMIYDPDRKKLIIYGGFGKDIYPEAWAWDGTAWCKMNFSNSIPAFYHDLLVYNPTAKQAIGFIGGDWGKTWIWSDETWKRMDLVNQPPLRSFMNYAFDPVSRNIYLFGGYRDGKIFNDTWIFNGTDWKQLTPAFSPPARSSGVSFYDDIRKSFVIYGGNRFRNSFNDMWELKLSEGTES
jgi:hypothetical protein